MNSAMEVGISPEILKTLTDYLCGEVVELKLVRDRAGHMEAVVRVFDSEARELNGLAGVPGSGVDLGEHYDEFFNYVYRLSQDGSRVTAVFDETGTLMEEDPLPWALREASAGLRPPSGPRSRPSSLA